MYTKMKTKIGTVLFRDIDTASIPEDLANTDYQAYLAWVSEGNEPEVIDNTATDK